MTVTVRCTIRWLFYLVTFQAHAFSTTFQKAGSPNSTIIFRIAQVPDSVYTICRKMYPISRNKIQLAEKIKYVDKLIHFDGNSRKLETFTFTLSGNCWNHLRDNVLFWYNPKWSSWILFENGSLFLRSNLHQDLLRYSLW
jgi:hypothetical protein